MNAFLFWSAVAVCCAQAGAQHFILLASPSYVWVCAFFSGIAPLVCGEPIELRWNARIAADALLDAFGLLAPAALLSVYPCAGSLAIVTLFRSLTIVFVALLKQTWWRLPEAVLASAVLALVTQRHATSCETGSDGVAVVVVTMLAVSLATSLHAVRQEERRTWRTTNLVRVPVLFATVVASGVAPRVENPPLAAFLLYIALSIGASRSVLAYNAAVKQDAYLKTRMLAVRRIITATLGASLLERFEPPVALLAIGAVAAISLVDFAHATRFVRQ